MTNKDIAARNKKVAAVAAGALVIGVGASYTLATWTDSEWVWGGADNDPGVATGYFNVQQNTTPGVEGCTFADFEENPGDELMFSAGALSLSPGDTIYAPVALRTEEDSVAGEIELQGAVAADGISVEDDNDLLWNAIEVSVYTTDAQTQPECDTDFDASDWDGPIIADGSLNTGATTQQGLDEDGGSIQHYCFVLTLPAQAQQGSSTELMGRSIAPAWEFAAESVEN